MAFQQTFDSASFDLGGMMDRSADMASKGREIGAEMINLSIRNLETAARAGRELTGVRDLGEAARIQMDYVKDVMGAFADHSARIADIVTAAGKQAGADAQAAAGKSFAATGDAARTAIGESEKAADKGFEAARKPGV